MKKLVIINRTKEEALSNSKEWILDCDKISKFKLNNYFSSLIDKVINEYCKYYKYYKYCEYNIIGLVINKFSNYIDNYENSFLSLQLMI